MKIKSYFAASVEAAIAEARQEFGPEAMLMNTRKSPLEARQFGEYEVVIACPNVPAPQAAAAAEAPVTSSSPDPLLKEIGDLRRQLERMASGITRARSISIPSLLNDPGFANIFSSLLALEIDPMLADSLLNGLRSRDSAITADDARQRLRHEIEAVAFADSSLGRPGHNRIVAVIGSPGCGKTTCIAKMAIQFGLTARKPTQFLSIDTERIGASDQLHTLAEILGAGFRAVETTHSLAQVIEESRNKHLILIDTPGIGPRDSETSESLASFFSRRDDIDVHLILPANLKTADLAASVDRFSSFQPHKLLFSRIDETRTYGAILNESVRTGKPVSFLSTGQHIPEDFEVATKSRIADLVLGDLTSRSSVAAA